MNPHRGEGEYWLLYTLSEGGDFKITGGSPEDYIQIIEKGWFKRRTGDFEPERIYPAFAMLVKTIDGYDFVLRQINKLNG